MIVMPTESDMKIFGVDTVASYFETMAHKGLVLSTSLVMLVTGVGRGTLDLTACLLACWLACSGNSKEAEESRKAAHANMTLAVKVDCLMNVLKTLVTSSEVEVGAGPLLVRPLPVDESGVSAGGGAGGGAGAA